MIGHGVPTKVIFIKASVYIWSKSLVVYWAMYVSVDFVWKAEMFKVQALTQASSWRLQKAFTIVESFKPTCYFGGFLNLISTTIKTFTLHTLSWDVLRHATTPPVISGDPSSRYSKRPSSCTDWASKSSTQRNEAWDQRGSSRVVKPRETHGSFTRELSFREKNKGNLMVLPGKKRQFPSKVTAWKTF